MDGLWVPTRRKGDVEVSYPKAGLGNLAPVEETSFWFHHRNRCVIEIVKRFPPCGPIWDIGGGNGWVSLGLSREGFPSFVVEPGATGAAEARRRGLKPVFNALFEDLELNNGSIDAAGMFDVLEHLPQPVEFLQKLREKMRWSGALFLTVPAYGWLWSDEDTHAGHYRRYDRDLLAAHLHKAGFRLIYISYFFVYLIPSVWLFRRLPSLLKLGKSRENDDHRTASTHQAQPGAVRKVLNLLSDLEVGKLHKGSLPFGTSIIVVATKG
jgi:SAM-dependent methyltransferase